MFFYSELKEHSDFPPDETGRMARSLVAVAVLGLLLSYSTAVVDDLELAEPPEGDRSWH